MAKKKPAVRKRGPQCDCISRFNKLLEPRNVRIDTETVLNFTDDRRSFDTMIIPVIKLGTLRRADKPKIFVTFCPICGKKYNWKTKKKETKPRGRSQKS